MIAARHVTVLLCFLLVGCENRQPVAAQRVEVRKLPGDLLQLVPLAGVPRYCLVYSTAERGPFRQLTMNEENESFDCPPGVAIGHVSFRIPKSEGKARIYVIFTDQKLLATTVTTQINDLATPNFSTLDLRVPGKAVSDIIEYTP